MKPIAGAVAAAWLVLACGAAGGGGDEARFAEACRADTNLGEHCDCIARTAQSELSDAERDFVLASLEDDEDRIAKLRGELGLVSATNAAMFMVNTPAKCAAAAGATESR